MLSNRTNDATYRCAFTGGWGGEGTTRGSVPLAPAPAALVAGRLLLLLLLVVVVTVDGEAGRVVVGAAALAAAAAGSAVLLEGRRRSVWARKSMMLPSFVCASKGRYIEAHEQQ